MVLAHKRDEDIVFSFPIKPYLISIQQSEPGQSALQRPSVIFSPDISLLTETTCFGLPQYGSSNDQHGVRASDLDMMKFGAKKGAFLISHVSNQGEMKREQCLANVHRNLVLYSKYAIIYHKFTWNCYL